MRNAYKAETIRAAERALMGTLPPGTLMSRAAAGLASVCAGLLPQVYGARAVVLAGSGDNGGDALYAGARLARRGARVVAVAAGTRVHPGGVAALRAAGGRITGAADPAVPGLLGGAGLVLDGLLGIGGQGGLRDDHDTLAGVLAGVRAGRAGGSQPGRPLVVAADLPSGISADTGEVQGSAVWADVTVTFGTWKPGLLIDPGAAHAGVTELIDIGLGPYLPEPDTIALTARDVAAMLPHPGRDSDKYRRGVLGVVAGSDRFTGAAALSVGGAIRGGAGMIRLVSAQAAAAVVRQHWPETVITHTGNGGPGSDITDAGRVQAWLAGPGMGTDEAARLRLAAVLETDLPVLADADGLTLIAASPELLRRRHAPALLTPHAGELARLLGAQADQVAARRAHYARTAADQLGCCVLLKGSTTVIATPGGGPLFVNTAGSGWLATAGSGDVLAGLAGALIAQGLPVHDAAAAAAFLHGLAARIAAGGGATHEPAAEAPIGASDVIAALGDAIRTVEAVAFS